MKTYSSKIFYLKKKVVFPYCAMRVELRTSPMSLGLSAGDTIIAYPVRSLFDIVFYRKKTGSLVEITAIEKNEKSVKMDIKGLSRVTPPENQKNRKRHLHNQ